MHTLWREAHVAIRGLLHHPGFTTVAVLTLALGIALNATMFSVVDSVLLQPLAYQEARQLVVISARANDSPVQLSFPGCSISAITRARSRTWLATNRSLATSPVSTSQSGSQPVPSPEASSHCSVSSR